jgi:hypothetical protein
MRGVLYPNAFDVLLRRFGTKSTRNAMCGGGASRELAQHNYQMHLRR